MINLFPKKFVSIKKINGIIFRIIVCGFQLFTIIPYDMIVRFFQSKDVTSSDNHFQFTIVFSLTNDLEV